MSKIVNQKVLLCFVKKRMGLRDNIVSVMIFNCGSWIKIFIGVGVMCKVCWEIKEIVNIYGLLLKVI